MTIHGADLFVPQRPLYPRMNATRAGIADRRLVDIPTREQKRECERVCRFGAQCGHARRQSRFRRRLNAAVLVPERDEYNSVG